MPCSEQEWREAQAIMYLLEPYVRAAPGRAEKGHDLGFESRVPARHVLGMFQLLCKMQEIADDPSPMLVPIRQTLERVKAALELGERRTLERGRGRKGRRVGVRG